MNLAQDQETSIVGFGRTPEEAIASLRFNKERAGYLSQARKERRDILRPWLPTNNLLHVTGVCAILHQDGYFINTRTDRKVRAISKPLAHYLQLFTAFDGLLSYEDFTLTIGREVDEFLKNVSDVYGRLQNFPYIKPVESLKIKAHHKTIIDGLNFMESASGTLILSDGGVLYELDRDKKVNTECYLSYLLASSGYIYDGRSIVKVDGNI